MANTLQVQPDTGFIKDVIAGGGDDLKKCYQCATCASVCSLSEEGTPFPRAQMLKAQWGLSGQLMGDPAVWLCHDCGDCTKRCPRDARPSRVMGAIRAAVIKRCSVPGFMGTLVGSPLGVAALFLLPIVVLFLLFLYPFQIPAASAEHMEFANMFPQNRLEPLFFVISGLAALTFVLGTLKLIRALRANGASGSIVSGLVPALLEIVRHDRFGKCEVNHGRRLGHLLVMWGFIGLAIMGTVVGIGTWIPAGGPGKHLIDTPLPLGHPLKIFANVCAVVIFVGVVMLLANRLNSDNRSGSTYFDWFFLLLLGSVAITGILSEVMRLLHVGAFMYAVYFVHLTLIFALFLYAPYSKFAHLVYRTVAIAATWDRGHKANLAMATVAGKT